MTSLTASVQGADQLARTLTDAGREIADLRDVNRREGEAALALADIPVDTGRLEASADVEVDTDGFTLVAAADYASYVHAEDPFFDTAISRRETEYVEAVEDHIDTNLARVQGA